MIREFTKEELQSLDIPWGKAVGSNEVVDTWPWGEEFEVVFEFGGRYWMTWYRQSSGDDNLKFDDMFVTGFPVKAQEVEEKEILVKKWVSVD